MKLTKARPGDVLERRGPHGEAAVVEVVNVFTASEPDSAGNVRCADYRANGGAGEMYRMRADQDPDVWTLVAATECWRRAPLGVPSWSGSIPRSIPARTSPSIATRKLLGLLLTLRNNTVSPPPADNHHWAELMRRRFGIDVLACPRCGGRLALIASVEDPAVIGRILRHLGLQATIPEPCPARSPPLVLAS